MVKYQSKLCDRIKECLDGSDESELYCGTGCLKSQKYESRFINCGRKFIKIINAWNVPAYFPLEFYIAKGEAINISKIYLDCSSLHRCDVNFNEWPHPFAVVKFQCEALPSTSSPTLESTLESILKNTTKMYNKSFSQRVSTNKSTMKENKLPAFSSTSPSTIYHSLMEMLRKSTKQNVKSIPQTTTTSQIGVAKEDKLHVAFIIIGVLGGVILSVLIPIVLYRLRRHIVGLKKKTTRSIPKINTMENVTYDEGQKSRTQVPNNISMSNVNEKEHESIEYATPNKIKNVDPKSELEAAYICNSSDTYDHLGVVFKKSQDEHCGNIYDHSYATTNLDDYDSIQR